MSAHKYWQLVQLLLKRTAEGKAEWETTSVNGVYAMSLPDFSVRIRKSVDYEGDAAGVMIQIVNSEGVAIDSFTDDDVRPVADDPAAVFRTMVGLVDQARRHAFGVDKALDSLIEQLGKG